MILQFKNNLVLLSQVMDYSVSVCLDQLVIVCGFQHIASGEVAECPLVDMQHQPLARLKGVSLISFFLCHIFILTVINGNRLANR